MRENRSLNAWRNGGQTVGCWLSLANTYSAEAIANLGFDWVCIDLQHGMIDYTDLANMLPDKPADAMSSRYVPFGSSAVCSALYVVRAADKVLERFDYFVWTSPSSRELTLWLAVS